MRSFSQLSENQASPTSPMDLLFDTHHRRIGFRINDQTEEQWAFYLSKQIQIDQLYSLVILKSVVSIDDS